MIGTIISGALLGSHLINLVLISNSARTGSTGGDWLELVSGGFWIIGRQAMILASLLPYRVGSGMRMGDTIELNELTSQETTFIATFGFPSSLSNKNFPFFPLLQLDLVDRRPRHSNPPQNVQDLIRSDSEFDVVGVVGGVTGLHRGCGRRRGWRCYWTPRSGRGCTIIGRHVRHNDRGEGGPL